MDKSLNDFQVSTIKDLLDKLLESGKEYTAKGQDLAEQKLNIPDSGPEREAMVNGLKKGALASAVLVGLLGTKKGRSLTKTAIKLGGLAALGAAAFKGYKNWQATGDPLSSEAGQSESSQALHELNGDEASNRSLLILEALVSAAHADGHVDDQEIQTIRHELIDMHLPEQLAEQVETILNTPLNAQSLADKVTNKQAASEVYMATRLLINDESSSVEQVYLDQLATALEIQGELRSSLEKQA